MSRADALVESCQRMTRNEDRQLSLYHLAEQQACRVIPVGPNLSPDCLSTSADATLNIGSLASIRDNTSP